MADTFRNAQKLEEQGFDKKTISSALEFGDSGLKIIKNYGDDATELLRKSVDKKEAVSKLNDAIDYKATNNQIKGITLRIYSNEYPNTTNFDVSARIKHSNIGDFNNNNRLINGGHEQANIEELKKRNIIYNIEDTYENGVRVGNIPTHKNKAKQSGINQAWFPKEWTDTDIEAAGKSVLSNRSVVIASIFDGKITSYTVFGEYNDVTVGVITDINGEVTSKIGTIFPDNYQRGIEGFKKE